MPERPRTPRTPRQPRQPVQPAVDLKDPVLALLKERPMLSTQDLQQEIAGTTGATPQQVGAALGQLHQEGYLYPPEEGYWSITQPAKAGGRQAPTAVYEKAAGISPDDFFTKEFPKYYNHFKQLHPELLPTLERVERSPQNFKGMVGDIQKIFLGQYKSFNTTDKKIPLFKAPEVMSSVEQAIALGVNEIRQYHPSEKGKIPSLAVGYETQKKTHQYFEAEGQELMTSIGNSVPAGTVVTKDVVVAKIKELVRWRLTAEEKETFYNYLYGNVINGIDVLPNPVFTTTTQAAIVETKLRNAIASARTTAPAAIMANFIGTGQELRKDVAEIRDAVVSNNKFQGVDLTKFDFTNAVVKDSDFSGTNLTESTWTEAKVSGCNFTNAIMKSAVFNPAGFIGNKLDGADFDGAAIAGKGIDYSKNSGTPLNYQLKSLELEPTAHKEVLKQGYYYTTEGMVGSTPQDKSDAKAIAKILGRYLQKMGVESDLSYVRVFRSAYAGLNSAVVEQLKHWLADNTATPPFLGQLQGYKSPVDWWKELIKNPEGIGDDFTKDEISGIFRLLTAHSRGQNPAERKQQQPAPKPKPAEAGDESAGQVEQFFATHQLDQPLTKQDLLTVLKVRDSSLAGAIQELPNELDKRSMYYLRHRLITDLNEFHHNTAVPPVKGYKSFPVKAKPQEVFESNYGTGKQFAIPMFLEQGSLPPKIKAITDKIITHLSSHILGSFSWARVMPQVLTVQSGTGRPTTKLVWQITEMQSDCMQQFRKNAKSVLQKPEADAFQNYYRNWPEVQLDIVLEYANNMGVDEVWMPTGEAVVKKTWKEGQGALASNLKRDDGSFVDWSDRYDRPAEAFGGKKKNVGVNAVLDPGTNYAVKEVGKGSVKVPNPAHASPYFFVVPVKPAGQRSAALENLVNLRFADLDQDDLAGLATQLGAFLPTFIQNYKGSQPHLAEYVADDWVADGGLKIFLEQHQDMGLTNVDIDWLKNHVAETLGYHLVGPPFVDWMHAFIYASVYVDEFVKGQEGLTPGMASKEEYARDAVKFVEEGLPPDVKESPRYQEFLPKLAEYLKTKGYGDVLGQGLSFRTPSQEELTHPPDSPGAEMVGAEGDVLPPEEEQPTPDDAQPSPPGLQFEPPSPQEMVNDLLDQLSQAQQAGNTRKVQQIKDDLKRLTAARMGLRFDDFGLRLS